MYDMNFVLAKVDKRYDTVKGMNKKSTITIADVIANDCVKFYPECCPEYMATYRDMGGKVMKIAIDMSQINARETITFYPYR